MTSKQEQKLSFDFILDNDPATQPPRYKFDIAFSSIDIGDFDDFISEKDEGAERAEGEAEEGKVEEEESERERKSTDEESLWGVAVDRSEEGEKYEESHYEESHREKLIHEEEEVGEAEEILSSTVSTAEKFEEEARPPEEPDHELAEEPAEVTAEREVIINKIYELTFERSELQRKNRLLQLWVSRNMKKTQQRMTPSDPTKTAEEMEEAYKEVLRKYKMQVDDILVQETDLTYELQNYAEKIHALNTEDNEIFEQLLDREEEVSIGLTFAKTGRKITQKMMDNLRRRQIARREILAEDRCNYIFLQHRLEDLNTRLKIAETLGEGMTTMDYEALHIANVGYKDRLDERDRELEKLRIKIAETVNGVAQYKEKEVCIVEDIEFEQENLEEYRDNTTKVREHLNRTHVELNEVRETLNAKKLSAGLLVAPQELMEMEKMMKKKDELESQIELIKKEIKLYEPSKQRMKKDQMLSRTFL